MPYFDCALIPVPTGKLAAYKTFSEAIARVYRECGATRVVDCVLDAAGGQGADFHAEGAREALAEAVLRDFPRAADARAGETVVLSWTEWPSKAARDAGLQRALADPRVQPQPGEPALFEGHRLVAGGFTQLLSV
jgi:uncharacterized protein YbaA (DUF1428 family)